MTKLGLDAPPRNSGLRGRFGVDPRDLGDELVRALGPYPLEVLFVIPLDEESRVIECTLVAVGSPDHLQASPRAIWERAIAVGAVRIVMIHTHPAGGLLPSAADLAETERHIDVGRKIGLELFDHLIVGPDGCRSLRETTTLFEPRAGCLRASEPRF